jgi:hypothetical protein
MGFVFDNLLDGLSVFRFRGGPSARNPVDPRRENIFELSSCSFKSRFQGSGYCLAKFGWMLYSDVYHREHYINGVLLLVCVCVCARARARVCVRVRARACVRICVFWLAASVV